MTAFADLLTGLVFSPGRIAKLRLLQRFFELAPDPDRGWALAAICGEMDLKTAQPAVIRGLAADRVDPVLFALSYDYVGDLAETVSLIWPDADADVAAGAAGDAPLALAEVVETLRGTTRAHAPATLARLLDRMRPDERFALIKLATGGLRVGVSARLGRVALSEWAASRGVEAPVAEIEEIWHALEPPYTALFAWASGAAGAPQVDLSTAFRPMMLAHPLDTALYSSEELRENEETDTATLSRLDAKLAPGDFAAEWKWDGVRVQAAGSNGAVRIYSRTGEDMGAAFPELVEGLSFDACVDGELLIVRDGEVAPFSDLQRRLGRKTVSAKTLRESPAHVCAYDLLFERGEDLRGLPFRERRARLERFIASEGRPLLDVSPLIPFESWSALAEIRGSSRAASQEGLMLKRWDSAYQGGRLQGPWYKWKRDPLSLDCVLLYAQRGHGKRSSFYSDFTFGAWREGPNGLELTPVGKAYSGYTDAELKEIDRWIRANTTERFGPVRAVKPEIVFEIAFDAVQRSTRHKSGVAMRFPRIKRIRWDKPAAEADLLETLERLIPPSTR